MKQKYGKKVKGSRIFCEADCCKLGKTVVHLRKSSDFSGPEESSWTLPLNVGNGVYFAPIRFCPFCGSDMPDVCEYQELFEE